MEQFRAYIEVDFTAGDEKKAVEMAQTLVIDAALANEGCKFTLDHIESMETVQ